MLLLFMSRACVIKSDEEVCDENECKSSGNKELALLFCTFSCDFVV